MSHETILGYPLHVFLRSLIYRRVMGANFYGRPRHQPREECYAVIYPYNSRTRQEFCQDDVWLYGPICLSENASNHLALYGEPHQGVGFDASAESRTPRCQVFFCDSIVCCINYELRCPRLWEEHDPRGLIQRDGEQILLRRTSLWQNARDLLMTLADIIQSCNLLFFSLTMQSQRHPHQANKGSLCT